MSGTRRSIRARVWASDDKADSRHVGENLRDVQTSLDSIQSQRFVTISNQFYTGNGVVFSHPTRPLGIVNVYSEAVGGGVLTSPLSGMSFDRGVVTVKLSALTVGTRYTTIRLQVFG